MRVNADPVKVINYNDDSFIDSQVILGIKRCPEDTVKNYSCGKVLQKWDMNQWSYFDELVKRESNWNPKAINKTSGACGIPQSYPCAKLGENWEDAYWQIDWMIEYVEERYGNPQKAIEWHNEYNWY